MKTLIYIFSKKILRFCKYINFNSYDYCLLDRFWGHEDELWLLPLGFFLLPNTQQNEKNRNTVYIPVGLLYRLGPGGPELMKRKREKERESSISWVTWKTNKAHTQDLYHSRRHRVSSQGGLESPGKKVSSLGFHALKK